MKYMTFAVSLLLLGLCQAGAMAFCPTSFTDVIFCDDFDTYCATGGYPGDTPCVAPDGNGALGAVWYRTSAIDSGEGCGTGFKVEDFQYEIFLTTTPLLAARYPSKVELGQQTVRDWKNSPPIGEPGQILDMRNFVGKVFGNQFSSVAASNSSPLVMEFVMASNVEKLFFSSGFMELALGDQDVNVANDYLDRANTDYATWPKSACCSGTVIGGPWPVLCAQGNPDPAIPVGAGCPSVATNPPPVHRAIAVGSLTVVDTDPCHCGTAFHKPMNTHLTIFDGQLWWTLKATGGPPGAEIFGSVTSQDLSAPMPPPPDFPAGCTGGNFSLASPLAPNTNKSYNKIILTIKANTIKVELVSNIKASNGFIYQVYSSMDNIERKYTGPFDRIRSGVGPGCELAPNMGWATCKTVSGRGCLATPEGYFVDFDDFVLHGGYGFSIEGACCSSADGTCSMTLQEECVGRWSRSGLRCEDTACCSPIFGDTSGDGSVDMDDFATLQTCVTTGGGTINSACRCLDFNGDNAINGTDIQHFADCANGPGVPGNSLAPCAGRGW